MSAAGKAGDWGRVTDLHARMRAAGIAPDAWTFSSLMLACQACGNRWRDALAFLAQMEDAGALPVLPSGTVRVAFDSFGALGLKPFWRTDCNEPSLHRLLAACMPVSLLRDEVGSLQGLQLQLRMQALMDVDLVHVCMHAGLAGNVVTYTTLMNVCARGGQTEHAMRLFRTMEADGLDIDVVILAVPLLMLHRACGGLLSPEHPAIIASGGLLPIPGGSW